MEKLQGLCTVISVTVPEGLSEYNEENNTFRARLEYSHDTANVEQKVMDGADEELCSALNQAASGNTFSVLIDLGRLEMCDKGKTDEEKASIFADKFVGKKAVFTTWRFMISEVFSDETALHTDSRTIRTLNNGYLGFMDDVERAKIDVQNRAEKQIADGVLNYGPFQQQQQNQQRRR